MKRTNTASISQVISELLGEYKIAGKLREARVKAAWHEVLGPLARPTDELYINNKVLFVKLTSSVVCNELSMMRSTLVQRLNEKAGEVVIENIVFR
jgi:predicted nucleic acid-binding Zn ribbon protein